MPNNNLRECRQFLGCLKTEAFTVLETSDQGISYYENQVEAFDIPVNFRAHLNSSGEIEFDFDPISITKENRYLSDYLLPRETGLSYFSIVGKSDDGTELEIERIHFSSEHFYDGEKQDIILSRGKKRA